MAITTVEPLRFGFFNCYLICGNDASILVDTAMPKRRKELLEQVKDRNVRLVLLTHGHLDHAGNAAYLSDQLGVPVAMSEADYPLITGGKLILRTDALVAKIIRPFFKAIAMMNELERFSPVFVKDGDRLSEYGVDGTIVALPGHTDGSIGVLLEGGTLISGDATTNVFYTDKEQMRLTAKKIAGMGLERIYPGHGDAQTPEEAERISRWQ